MIKHIVSVLSLGILVSIPVMAAPPLPSAQDEAISQQQLIYQQERQKAQQESLSPNPPDISLLPNLPKTELIIFPQESVCFPIHTITLLGKDTIPFHVPINSILKQGEDQCLGGQGINLLMTTLQNQLISYGYITTRIVAPEQDITSGELRLLVVKGVMRDVYFTQDSDTHSTLALTMPMVKGEILNLRDIEQGLENMQRIPASAQMQLIPGDKPGETDVVITRQQPKFWRVGLSVDDSGTKSTGRYQGGATLYLDNILSLSDAFYMSGGHDIDGRSQYGSKNYLFSYSFPVGYWQFSLSKSGNTYNQTVAGAFSDYVYSGRSNNAQFQVSRILHRNESQKTTLSYGLLFKESHNYINDVEVEVQGRRTTSWKLGLQHRQYIDNITLNIGASYQKGVSWFGAKTAPEQIAGTGTALSDIIQANIALAAPFSLAEQQLRYNLDLNGQYSRGGDLTAPERFSIGGRWSVRGFDGELTLSADNGWTIRNDLSLVLPNQHELYLALDAGGVFGADSGYLIGKRLVGSAVGLRGSVMGIYYDAFMGKPIYKPTGFQTSNVTLGFNLNWNY